MGRNVTLGLVDTGKDISATDAGAAELSASAYPNRVEVSTQNSIAIINQATPLVSGLMSPEQVNTLNSVGQNKSLWASTNW